MNIITFSPKWKRRLLWFLLWSTAGTALASFILFAAYGDNGPARALGFLAATLAAVSQLVRQSLIDEVTEP